MTVKQQRVIMGWMGCQYWQYQVAKNHAVSVLNESPREVHPSYSKMRHKLSEELEHVVVMYSTHGVKLSSQRESKAWQLTVVQVYCA